MSKKNAKCVCPYLPCPIHGFCHFCIMVSKMVKAFPNCMEPNVEACGGCLPRKRPKQTIVCDNFEEMSQKTAAFVADVLKEKPDALICLTADPSLQRSYEILAGMARASQIDFSRARFAQFHEVLDARMGKPVFAGFLQEALLDPIGARADQILFFDGQTQDIPGECERMDRLLEENGDIDCMLLGIGPRAQLGFNEPDELFDCGTKAVEISAEEAAAIRKNYHVDGEIKRGITLGLQHVFCAEKVVLAAGGAEKAGILAETYATLPQIKNPATALFLVNNGTVILDRDAAGMIQEL